MCNVNLCKKEKYACIDMHLKSLQETKHWLPWVQGLRGWDKRQREIFSILLRFCMYYPLN